MAELPKKATVKFVADTSEFENAMKGAHKAVGMLMLIATASGWLEEHFWELEAEAERYEMPLDEFVKHLLDTAFEAHKSLSDEDIKASHVCEDEPTKPQDDNHTDDGGPEV